MPAFNILLMAVLNWENVGSANEAADCNNKNWFNYTPITNLPVATVRDGWSGNIQATQGICQGGSGSGGWVNASHTLYQLAYKKNVLFRFVFGSGSTCNDYDGFAVDDIVFSNHPPAPKIESLQFTNVACFGDFSATASVVVSSSAPPFTVKWMNGTASYSGVSVNRLPAGAYNVTIKDANDCSVAQDFSILQPAALSLSVTANNATCNFSNGSAEVTGRGGVEPYNFTWQPTNQTGAIITGVAPGKYVAVLGDANGCNATKEFSIENIGGVSALVNDFKNVSCFGAGDGVATVTSTGAGPFTYLWSPIGGTEQTAKDLPAGNYAVTVKDIEGCTDIANVQIIEPTQLQATTVVQNAGCGKKNGTAEIVVTGGTGGYTYLWTPGNFVTAKIDGLSPANYQCTVTDAKGCSKTMNVAVGADDAPTISSLAITDVRCFGKSNGGAVVNLQGGNLPYSITWRSGSNQFSGSLQNVPAGNYTLSVSDARGCTIDSALVIGQPVALKHTVATTPISCTAATGSAGIIESGGTGAYTYTWNPGGYTTASATGLQQGDYLVTVEDARSCIDTVHIAIQNTSSLTVAVNNVKPVSCYNGSDGSITVSASNAVKSYEWLPAGSNSATNSNLKPGQYSVTITDQQGCMATVVTQLAEPAKMVLAVSVLPTFCGQNNGKASVVASGGTGNIEFLWSPGNYTTAQPEQMAAGALHLQATDANGCTQAVDTTIRSSQALQPPNITTVPVTCFGGQTGSVAATMLNGTAPFTYQWAGPGGTYTGASVGSLSAGDYTLRVQDAEGCAVNSTKKLTEPDKLTHMVNLTFATCGNNNGAATIIETGGTQPYQYKWSQATNTGRAASNLAPGDYLVYITDNNNCSDSVHFTLVNIGGIQLTIDLIKSVSCFGKKDGFASITAEGNAAPFNYQWSPAAGSGTAAKNLAPGTYTTTVTDQQGCRSAAVIEIKEPQLLAVVVEATSTTCNKQNGTASVAVSGGTLPYSYLWQQNSAGTAAISGLSSGQYFVTVTDANQCAVVDLALVMASAGVQINSISTTAASCFGVATGTATPAVSGGAAPYAYRWMRGANTWQEPVLQQALAGEYQLIVTDGDGCADSGKTIITEPAQIALQVNTTPTTCGLNNGTATANASGGNAPYSYNWSGGGSGPTMSNISAGNHRLTVTDASNCMVENNLKVQASAPLRISLGHDTTACPGSEIDLSPGIFSSYTWHDGSHGPVYRAVSQGKYSVSVIDGFGCTASAAVNVNFNCVDLVFPNAFTPNGDRVNDQFGPLGTLGEVKNYNLKIFNRWGQVVFATSNPYQKWDGRQNAADYGNGAYIWMAEYSFNGQPRRVQKGTILLVR